jgi:hypothetical protein
MRLPNDTQRLTIVGKTGEGKSQAAMWHLSHRNYDKKPWGILDFKNDGIFNRIGGFQHIDLNDDISRLKNGVYVFHPESGADDDAVENLMRKIHRRGNFGLYVDEGYMLDQRSKAYNALLTQGRSLHIPMINLSQRPSWISKFVISEAEFIQVFRLIAPDDIKKVQGFVRNKMDMDALPRYHSYYYDVAENKFEAIMPVEDEEIIIDRFDKRLPKKSRFI